VVGWARLVRGAAGAVISLVLAVWLVHPASAQIVLPPEQGPITLTAEHIEYDEQTGDVNASGHVVATRGGSTVSADHLTGNLKTGDVQATGHVTLTQPGKTVTGESLHYNYLTRVGAMSQATAKNAPWTVTAQTMTTTAARSEALAASMTPCDPAHPAFRVTARKVDIVPGDYLKAYDATLYVYGVAVLRIPVYTASLKRRRNPTSAPKAGYDNVNGVWVEYGQYFPLGDWDAQIRVRYGTRSGFSGEAIFNRSFPDYLLDLHLGRTLVFNQNGQEFNIDQYTAELDSNSYRIWRLPAYYYASVQSGQFTETETAVSALRTQGQFTVTTDTFRLNPSLTVSASGYYLYDSYSTGQVRNVLAGSAALDQEITPRSSVTLTYNFTNVYGTTPFNFDSMATDSAVSLAYSYYPGRGLFQNGTISETYDFVTQQTIAAAYFAFAISPTLLFGTSVEYNTTLHQMSEVDYSVNATCDCVSVGVVYRTFPMTPSSNQWYVTVGINTIPGLSTRMSGAP
jgi:lipopolysaccharide export system protein LptA